ncbi:reverse transcriptase domain-containing protein [Tanacetum coccineum]
MLFPFSVEGAARIWLEKEPPRSILTWDDLVSKFINEFFPPSKTTNLRNEITGFQQRFEESFSDAWDRFKELLRACPHHGFSELHQLDTFYNALNENDQDSLNSAAGGNFLDKRPNDYLRIIESKSKVHHSRSKAIKSKVNTTTSTPGISPDVDELKDMEEIVYCALGNPSYRYCPAIHGNNYRDNIQSYMSQAATVKYNQGNSGYRLQPVANQIQPPGFPLIQNKQFNQGNNSNQGIMPYQVPIQQSQVVTSNELETFKKTNEVSMQAMRNHITNLKAEIRSEMQTTMQNQNKAFKNELTNEIKGMLGQFLNMNSASPSSSGSLPSTTIPNPKGEIKVITTRSGLAYDGPPALPTPSTSSKEVEQEPEILMDQLPKPRERTFKVISKDSKSIPPLVVQSSYEPVEPARAPNSFEPSSAHNDDSFKELHKFLEMFKKLHFNISLAEALILMPKYTKMMKDLILNKEKLFEVANTPLTENCSAVIMKKLLEKLRDPGRFLIPCDFNRMPQCMALADLGASINLMPLGIYYRLNLPELIPTKMTLELANGSLAIPSDIAEDVLVKVGKFTFPADFVVVDYEVNYRVPLILGGPFLRTARALIDVHGEELILRDGEESTTQSFEPSNVSFSPSLTPSKGSDSILGKTDSLNPFYKESGRTTSFSNTPPSSPLLETSDVFLDEVDAFLAYESIPSGNDDEYYDSKGDVLYLEELLNDDSSQLPPMDPKQEKETKAKSSTEEPTELEDLSSLSDEPSEESSESIEIVPLSSFLFGNEDKVFNPGILSLKRTQKFYDFKSMDSEIQKEIISFRILLLYFTVTISLLSLGSEDTIFDPDISA